MSQSSSFPKQLGVELVHLARTSIHAAFSNKNIQIKESLRKQYKQLEEQWGVFVNLYLKDELRGSFGYPPGAYPLADGIKRAARGAAFLDRRYVPLQKSEANNLMVEVVIIQNFRQLEGKEDYFKKINPKKQGIFVSYGPFRALQLPQFAGKLSSREYLEFTLEKASLAPQMWQSPALKVFTFTTTSFSG